MKDELNLYQISDLHIRQNIPGSPAIPLRRGRQGFTNLTNLCDKIEAERGDALIITGDILDVPRWILKEGFYYEYDFTYWEQMIYLDYMSLAALFKKYSFPVWLLPGNHDEPKLFRSIFGRQLEPKELGGYTFYFFSDWAYRASSPRRLDKERKLFDVALDSGPDNQIHCQHYVVSPKIEQMYPYNYLEYQELTDRIIQSNKVLLSLSGHYHKGAQSIQKNPKGNSTCFHTAKSFSEGPFPYYQIKMSEGQSEIKQFFLEENENPRKAVFFDRDGCLTQVPRFNSGPDEIILFEGAGEALFKIQELGYKLIIISDQSSIGMGYTLKEIVHWTNDEMCRQLKEFNVNIDGVYFSEGGGGRAVLKRLNHTRAKKPSPDLILAASQDLNLSLKDSIMIGDRITDCQSAINAGVKPFLVRTGFGIESEGQIAGDENIRVVDSLNDFSHILSEEMKFQNIKQ